LCAPHDTWAEDILLPVASPGDLLAVFQSGAYGASASPQAFLGKRPAAELLIEWPVRVADGQMQAPLTEEKNHV
jgi:diaminopimelate decarboxylase